MSKCVEGLSRNITFDTEVGTLPQALRLWIETIPNIVSPDELNLICRSYAVGSSFILRALELLSWLKLAFMPKAS